MAFITARCYSFLQKCTTLVIVQSRHQTYSLVQLIGYILAVLLSEIVVVWIIMYRPLRRVLHPAARLGKHEMKSPIAVICDIAENNARISRKWTYLCRLMLLLGATGQAFIFVSAYVSVAPYFKYISTGETTASFSP